MNQDSSIPKVRLCAIVAVLFACLFGSVAFGGWRPYSAGPLTPGDFQGPVPDPLPEEDGVEIKSKVAVGITIVSVGYTTQTQGGVVTVTATSVQLESGTDPNASWNSSPSDPNLLDHEQGHADEEEAIKRKAQAEIDKLIKEGKLKGQGSTEEEAKADLEKKIEEIIEKHRDKKQENYDDKTGHGTKDEEQKKERERQKKELKEANVESEKKIGPNAILGALCSYTPGLGLLWESATIVEIEPPVPGDPAAGATVSMPPFTLVAEADGEFFFQADPAASTLSIIKDADTYLSCELDYIIYDPIINTFYGVGGAYSSSLPAGYSPYVDGVNSALTSDSLTLYGVEIVPTVDFMALTGGFMAPGTAPANGLGGMREVGQVPLNCADVWAYGLGLDGDINRDCYVNNEDLALLAENWLKCNNPLDSNCPEF